MIHVSLDSVRRMDLLKVQCDRCPAVFERRKRDLLHSRSVFGMDVCRSCGAQLSAATKPQCTKAGWDSLKREHHGSVMKSSVRFYEGIRCRASISGPANPMAGKTASPETRDKMRQARLGKIGYRATAWKGGRVRFLQRVRKMLETRFRWYSRVIERERGICQVCGCPGNEGHHREPIAVIVAELLKHAPIMVEDEALEWLMTQERLINTDLSNGKCVCRPCHKLEHLNWGSHEPTTKG